MTETGNRTKASVLALGRLQDSAQAVAAVAGAAAGIVAFIYVLGGAVMWLRFARAGLPADEAVAAMTTTMLLTVGVRLLVLPALILGILAIVLVAFTRAKERAGYRVLRMPRIRLGRRDGRRTPRQGAPGPDPPVRSRLSGRFVPRAATPVDQRSASDPVDGNRRVFRVASRVAAVIAIMLLVLALPFSGGGLAWLTAPLLLVYWWRGFGFAPRDRRDVSEFRLAALVIAVAAFITLARQFDDPVHLLRAKVEFVRTTGMKPLEGVFVSADSQGISVGDRGAKTIRTVRRADVASLALGPPVEYAPNASLLSGIVGGGEWSLVPFAVKGMWCDGVRYPWTKLGDLCQGSPRVEPSAARHGFTVTPTRNGDGVINAIVRCPAESPADCEGYARLTTVAAYGRQALGPLALPRTIPLPPLRESAAPFTVERRRAWPPVAIPVRRIDWETLHSKPVRDRGLVIQPVPMWIELSADPRGEAVFSRSQVPVTFSEPPPLPAPAAEPPRSTLRDRN